jgi:hypothetical protein
MNLGLVPQYGGTVGGIRRTALEHVGGWRDDTLAEDTDITFRLVLGGWNVVYQNRSECYEEVPETWPVRIAQIKRWAAAALRDRGQLLVWQGKDAVVVLPDGEKFLGRLGPGQAIAIVQVPGPSGPRLDAVVVEEGRPALPEATR